MKVIRDFSPALLLRSLEHLFYDCTIVVALLVCEKKEESNKSHGGKHNFGR